MISPELASFLSIALIIIGSVTTAFICLRWESGLTIESLIGSLAIAGICVGLVFGAAALGGIEAHGWWILPLVAVVTFIAKVFFEADYWLAEAYRRTRRTLHRAQHPHTSSASD